MRIIFQVFLFIAFASFVGNLVLDVLQKPTSTSLVKSSEEDSSDDEEKSDESEEDTRRIKEVDLFFENQSYYEFVINKLIKKNTVSEFNNCTLSHPTNPPYLPPDLSV